MRTQFIMLILWSIILIGAALAHEDHDKKKEKPDTITVVNGDTIAINGIAVGDSILVLHEAEEHEEAEVEKEGEFKLNFIDVMFEHIHNKIIHFPIVLAVVAFLFAVLGYRDERYQSVIKIMLFIAGVFAIVAFLTGTNQIDPFIGEPKEWLANTHRLFGIASAVSIWIWYLCLVVKPIKKFTWIFAIITVILISITGLFGGVLAH